MSVARGAAEGYSTFLSVNLIITDLLRLVPVFSEYLSRPTGINELSLTVKTI